MVQRAQYCFRALSNCFHHLEKTLEYSTASCPLIFWGPRNNPVALQNNTEHSEPLLIASLTAMFLADFKVKRNCQRSQGEKAK